MALSLAKRALLGSLVTCIVLVVVNASIGDEFKVPLFEVGSLWLRAVKDFTFNIKNMVFRIPDLDNPLTYVLLAVGAYVLWELYKLLFSPMDRTRLLGDLGYVTDGRMSMKETVNLVRKHRSVGDIPPVYPNGWFSVMESRDLKKSQSTTVNVLGMTLAIFRGDNGVAHVLDAYCPHIGANLGVGGQVKGSCIECPFHGWLFRGEDGKCVDIPGCEKKHIPDMAKVKSHTIVERNGFIYMWYHAEGTEPYWDPPEIEEIGTGEWAYRGRTEHYVNCHIEDVPENGADVAHLPQVHGPFITTGIDLRYTYAKLWSFAKHEWDGTWTASEEPDQKHVGTLSLTHSMSFFGINIPFLDMSVKAKQTGPGIVNLMFECPGGNGVIVHNVTPIEPMVQRVLHHIYWCKYTPAFIPKFFQYSEAMMIERDIMIWNNKKYMRKPAFSKNATDYLLARHRRWYSQFYSENSPRLNFTKPDNMEW